MYRPIEHAAQNGHLEVVKLLASHADIDKKYFVSAIDQATKNNHDDVCHYLSSLSDINAKDENGYTRLHHALMVILKKYPDSLIWVPMSI